MGPGTGEGSPTSPGCCAAALPRGPYDPADWMVQLFGVFGRPVEVNHRRGLWDIGARL